MRGMHLLFIIQLNSEPPKSPGRLHTLPPYVVESFQEKTNFLESEVLSHGKIKKELQH